MNASDSLASVTWPAEALGRAMMVVAQRTQLASQVTEFPSPPESVLADHGYSMDRWIESTANWMSFEAEPYVTTYQALEEDLEGIGPALIRIRKEGSYRYLVLLDSNSRFCTALDPNLDELRIPVSEIVQAIAASMRNHVATQVDEIMADAHISKSRQDTVRRALLRERIGSIVFRGLWAFRPAPGSSFYHRAKRLGLLRIFALLLSAHTAYYLLWLGSWWLIGAAALSGDVDVGWLSGWGLLLLTLVPLRTFVTWTQNRLAIGLGGLLKKHLLYGALCHDPSEIRKEGVGYLLGRVLESEAIEATAVGGGILGLLATMELMMAAGVLAWVAPLGAVFLGGWSVVASAIGYRYFQRVERWSHSRLSLTHDLVEQMVGYRTRLAQQAPQRWHEGEDQALETYFEHARMMDKTMPLLVSFIPKGWLLLGVLGLAPMFVLETDALPVLPAAIGGVLAARFAFERLTTSLASIGRAIIAWRQVKPLFQAASRPKLIGAPNVNVRSGESPEGGSPVVSVHDIVFRYRERSVPVLDRVSLVIEHGDRLLVEGESGCGKSTLASLLSGLRTPDSGLILIGGLDRHTLGEAGWRARVAHVPQFHENYVFTATFAFNLLMGKQWPAAPAHLEEAEQICRELGLGPLIDRMPAGLLQTVGDTGWQLSHGERSRLYIARALLQGADVLVLDESFAALDPKNLKDCLTVVRERAPTMVVIAHP